MLNTNFANDACAETLEAVHLHVPEPAPVPAESSEPLLFDRYRTIRELGRGGMGIVVLAHDTVLDLQVALKLIPEDVVLDTEGIVDLKKEVLRGINLTHPGIVRVFSFEQDAETAAIVMEHVDGQSLAQKKAQSPARCFDCDEIHPWLEQLCAALDYAHSEARIAHRDLKPANLMVTTTGRLKIADFGIAASLNDTASRVSVRGESSGTPPYMSPQQAKGERPTHLDDIYSLGATIYELLTGRPPFFRGNVLAQVVHEDAPSMTARREEFGVLCRAPIPAAWETMISACLAKEPSDRPQSGAALMEMLQNPGRAIVLKNAPLLTAKLELVPDDEPSRKDLKPAIRQPLQPVPVEPKLPVVRVHRPSRILALGGSMITGTAEVVGMVLSPLLKVGVALLILWIGLVVKGKWDASAAARAAEAKATLAAQAALEPEPPAANRVLQTAALQPAIQPPAFIPPPPPPGAMPAGMGRPPMPFPPPRR